MTLRALRRRVACALGFHRPTFWYASTGRTTDPLYEPRVECLFCSRRFR